MGYNFPVAGVAASNNVELFSLVIGGTKPSSTKIILNSNTTSSNIFLKKCNGGNSCTFSSIEINGVNVTDV